MPDYRERLRVLAKNAERHDNWYSIRAEVGSTSARIDLYDEIGWFGTTAKDFMTELNALDVEEIQLHVNSPGGDVFDGIAITNTLRQHKARVVATVDGVAASAASFIVTGGADEVIMAENSEMFIHDAWGLCVGSADDMTKMGVDLARISDNIASIYAKKAGGGVADWRAAMLAETWYSAEEAVTAGLADRVDAAKSAEAKAKFDLSMFAHAGRADAPRPVFPGRARAQKPPAEPADPPHPNPEGADMASDHLIQGLRDRLGISAEASLDDDGILAAVDEALAEQPTARPGTVTMDAATLADLQAAAEQGRQARAQQVADRRNALISAAIDDGRITPARREHWLNALAADPEGAEQTLAGLAKGLVPLAAVGYTGGVDESSDDDRIYALAFGKEA